LFKLQGEKSKNNSPAENMDGTENNGIIKIEALRRTYAALKWVTQNKKYRGAIKFKTKFRYFCRTTPMDGRIRETDTLTG
jgi:hypothetical protein